MLMRMLLFGLVEPSEMTLRKSSEPQFNAYFLSIVSLEL